MKDDPSSCLKIIQEVISFGRNLNMFIQEGIEFFRTLLFFHLACPPRNEAEFYHEDLPRFKELASRFKELQIVTIIENLCFLEMKMRSSLSPQVLSEVAFVKLGHCTNIVPIEKLFESLKKIEENLMFPLEEKKK